MQFYTDQHRYYCGIDLHARTMYVCILDQDADVLVYRRIRCRRRAFLRLIKPYRDDFVVGTECLCCWYWVAEESVPRRHDQRGARRAANSSHPSQRKGRDGPCPEPATN